VNVSRFLDDLGRRSRPHFGQLTLTILLVCGMPLALYFLSHPTGIHPIGERVKPSTALSWLPDTVLLPYRVRLLCGSIYLVSAMLWLLRLLLPWSSWTTALSFLALLCLYVENASQVTHVAHLTAMLLFIHAMWYHFYAQEIRQATRQRRFWTTALYPHWVHALSVFAIGTFYGWSGLNKLLTSGPGWANGLPLQLWVSLQRYDARWGQPSIWTTLILDDRRFAMLLQTATLIGETAGFFAVVWRPSRPWIGLLLIGFHIGQIAVFGWGFHANMLMLALFFLPGEAMVRFVTGLPGRWLARRASEGSSVFLPPSLGEGRGGEVLHRPQDNLSP
jgi:hypothetical protein